MGREGGEWKGMIENGDESGRSRTILEGKVLFTM